MKNTSYYSIGQFMQLAHVSKKTLRYYDEHNILLPSYVNGNGARFYTERDLAKMQQIQLFKHLGFSLDEIKEILITTDPEHVEASMILQKKLVDERIEQLQIISRVLDQTVNSLHDHEVIDWADTLSKIYSVGLENSLKTQYLNSTNINARISLHESYSTSKEMWFPWIFAHCHLHKGMQVLELGCGDGSFWLENKDNIPQDIKIILSDISTGMLKDAQTKLSHDPRFQFEVLDCSDIRQVSQHFELILANHVLFYSSDIKSTIKQVYDSLTSDGQLICSTYGQNHMKEINQIASSFDDRIVLSTDHLYDRFGKENGQELLEMCFTQVHWVEHEDSLWITDAEPIVSYILSCHGNQSQYIVDRYAEFKNHVRKCVGNGIHITKEAGIFICNK